MDVANREQGLSMSWMYSGLVDLALLNGDFASAMAPAEQGMQRAEQSGSPFMRAIALRALGLALGLNDRHAEGVEALSEALPMVTQGGLAYFFEANVLATLALVQQHADQLEDAERSSRAAIGSAQASGSRGWEILATLVWLRLPVDASRRAEADAARSEEHTSELQSLMRTSYAVVCMTKKKHIVTRARIHKLD